MKIEKVSPTLPYPTKTISLKLYCILDDFFNLEGNNTKISLYGRKNINHIPFPEFKVSEMWFQHLTTKTNTK